jgi:hypothetical protein
MPEVLAHREPQPDPQPRRRRPQDVARGEEPPLVEQAVRRQEQLAVDVADLAVLEQRRRDEEAVVAGLLDERHDRREAVGLGRERRETRVVEPDRDLRGEVLQEVASEPQLREDDETGAVGTGLPQQVTVDGQVLVEQAETWCDLSERDPERGRHHERRIPAEADVTA